MSIPDRQMTAPPLREIYFYLTEGCNLRCRHCWIMEEATTPTSTGKAVLDVQLFESILDQALPLGLTSVKFTGGEPFLNPGISHMLERVRDHQLNLVVETNAVLLTSELATQVASCRQAFVTVSLDGTDSETHEWVRRVPGSFQAALRGIGYLVHAGIKPQIIFTIMKKNRDQVTSIVNLAQELGAGSVKFNILQPSPRGDRMQEEGDAIPLPEVLKLCRWLERDLASSVGISIHIGYPPAFSPLKRVVGQQGARRSCGILGVIGVLANGSYALCGIGSQIPELVFGHASRDSLADVWQNNPVLQEIREGLPERLGGICSNCLLEKVCLGFCLAQNYYQARNLWTPFWFCQQAEAAGLFPESRMRSGNLPKKREASGVS